MRKPIAVIGMSPGNSYFKDLEVRFLLKESINRFGRCAVMVADVPAIATYMAMGYPANRARNKAIPKGNNIKNRTLRLAQSLGYDSDQVRIIDWSEEIEEHPKFQHHYCAIMEKFKDLPDFAKSVKDTCKDVLENSERNLPDVEAAAEGAAHYLLSELAFMEFAPEFLENERVCYLYHRNWQVYEDYIRGRFDNVPKPYLDFLLLEAPYETFQKIEAVDAHSDHTLHDTYTRIMRSGVLRAAYSEYPPVFKAHGNHYSGIFHDVILGFAQAHNLKVEWVEETGYGVIIDGLNEGRFDIFCSATWPTAARHSRAALSRPLYYSDVGVWVRANSQLAERDWISLNDESYCIAVTEGDITHEICLTDFVFAKWVRVPQLGRVKALLQFVADGRADATMVERLTYDSYANELSEPLVNIAKDKPIRRYPNCFLVGKNQHDFLEVLNKHIEQVKSDGTLKAIVETHAKNFGQGAYFVG
ncbi:MAG TPA: tRNA-dependent cyclodipeptide synthase [Oculatellaceae cyanobacterium]